MAKGVTVYFNRRNNYLLEWRLAFMELKQTKIGFLGFGNIAQAIAKGWILSNEIQPEQLYASARDQKKLALNAETLGIHSVATNRKLVKLVDIVIVSVKPHQINEMISPLKEVLRDKTVVSVAVNYLYEDFEKILSIDTQHLSTLPNTSVAFGNGVILFEEKHSLSETHFNLIKNLFQLISHVEMIPTDQMAIAGIITGSAPAFVDLFIEALADAAVKHGLDRKLAYRLISQMISGTANLQLKTGKHPGELKDEITSPGGTTIKGIASLEKNAFRGSLIEAVDEILKDY